MIEWSEEMVERVGWNLPGELPPGIGASRRRFAGRLQRLATLALRTMADMELFEAATSEVDEAIELLERAPEKSPLDALADGTINPSDHSERAALIGPANPFAPPVRLVPEGEVSVGLVTFGPLLEGAPGRAHGGFIAAVYDQVFGYAGLRRGTGSVTGSLTVRYLRPTPIDRPLRVEVRLVAVDGREARLAGRMLHGERVLSEADAVMISIDSATFLKQLLSRRTP